MYYMGVENNTEGRNHIARYKRLVTTDVTANGSGERKVDLDSCLLIIKKPTNLSTSEPPLQFDFFKRSTLTIGSVLYYIVRG